MRLYDDLSQEQTSGFVYNKVLYFCAIRNGGFHIYIYDSIYIYIYVKKKTSSGVNLEGISQIIKKCFFFPASEIYVYMYIYIYGFVHLTP